MSDPSAARRQISAPEAREHWTELVDEVAHEGQRILITGEHEVVALISLADLDLLEQLEDRADAMDFEVALCEARRESSKSLDQVISDLKL
jgi:prevent-host-death family protein